MKNLISLIIGFGFGLVLISSEAFHWYRIQEMFRFRSFHMYGVLFSAILTAAISIIIIRRFKIKSINGKIFEKSQKEFKPVSNSIGGLIFGIGWAITGACAAPMYILIGFNWKIGLIALAGALSGTLLFGLLKNKFSQL
jgi:uncharacterized membrane protein YedE/YeeE